jgi:hypothetical protein
MNVVKITFVPAWPLLLALCNSKQRSLMRAELPSFATSASMRALLRTCLEIFETYQIQMTEDF